MADDKMSLIEKVTSILGLLSNEPYAYKVGEISDASGINRTTVYRILGELAKDGWIIQDEEAGKFKIGPMTYHVGSIYCSNTNYDKKIQDILHDLSAECKESVGYAIREGDRVISLYEIEFYQPLKLDYSPGRFYPMNRGCYGKCLMAYHDQKRVRKLLAAQKFEKLCPNTLTEPEEILREYESIRKKRYVISDEEVAPCLMGVGVPVFNTAGQVSSCIVTAFVKGSDYKEKVALNLAVLRRGAEAMSKYVP